ncbi:hypothetical protein ES703_53960 [subsurface metagenome]
MIVGHHHEASFVGQVVQVIMDGLGGEKEVFRQGVAFKAATGLSNREAEHYNVVLIRLTFKEIPAFINDDFYIGKIGENTAIIVGVFLHHIDKVPVYLNGGDIIDAAHQCQQHIPTTDGSYDEGIVFFIFGKEIEGEVAGERGLQVFNSRVRVFRVAVKLVHWCRGGAVKVNLHLLRMLSVLDEVSPSKGAPSRFNYPRRRRFFI